MHSAAKPVVDLTPHVGADGKAVWTLPAPAAPRPIPFAHRPIAFVVARAARDLDRGRLTPRERRFVHDMVALGNRPLTDRQYTWLRKILARLQASTVAVAEAADWADDEIEVRDRVAETWGRE